MKPLFLFIPLMLLLHACSPEPVFRMTPQANNTTFNQGTEYAHLQKKGIELTISYYRHIGDRFVMDVEIVNTTDSVLRVDPLRFSYKAYRDFIGSSPGQEATSIAYVLADDPESELLKVDKNLSRAEASQKTNTLLYAVAQGAAIAGEVTADTEEEKAKWEDTRQELFINRQYNQHYRKLKRLHLRDRRQVWQIDALRKTDLFPGEYIRGYVFFKNSPDAYGYVFQYNSGQTNFEIFFRQQKYKVR